MPRAAVTVSVELTRRDLQVLRRLIIAEAARLHGPPGQSVVVPAALNVVARKIWVARQRVELMRVAQGIDE